MSFLIKDNKLLKHASKSIIRSTIILEKNLTTTKTRYFNGKINTDFHDSEMLKDGSPFSCSK